MADRYDPANWLKHNRASIFHTGKPGTLIDTGKEYRSPLLFVRWTRSGRPGGEVAGLIEAEIISPLGRPARPSQLFNISTDPEVYQFWTVTSDRLPYRLHARMVDNPKITSQLEIWEFIPLINIAPMATVNNPPSVSAPIDLTPLVNAIQVADQNATSANAAIQGQLGQLVTASAQAINNKFDERTVKEFTGNSLDGYILDPDTARRTVVLTLPAIDVNGNSQPAPVQIAIGDASRGQIDDFNYTLLPGGSVTIEGSEAIQRISAWLPQGAAPQICNLTWIFI
jgi:hypothetical protein